MSVKSRLQISCRRPKPQLVKVDRTHIIVALVFPFGPFLAFTKKLYLHRLFPQARNHNMLPSSIFRAYAIALHHKSKMLFLHLFSTRNFPRPKTHVYYTKHNHWWVGIDSVGAGFFNYTFNMFFKNI